MRKSDFQPIHVIILEDLKRVMDKEGRVYQIAGLIIGKPDSPSDEFYPHGTDMCNAIVFPWYENNALLGGNSTVILT